MDTMVATNLHADILSDFGRRIAGIWALPPTANLDPEAALSLHV